MDDSEVDEDSGEFTSGESSEKKWWGLWWSGI